MRTRMMTGWTSVSGRMVMNYTYIAITAKPYKLKRKYR